MPSPEVHYCGHQHWAHRLLGVDVLGQLVTEPFAIRCDLQTDHEGNHEVMLPNGRRYQWPAQ